MSFLAGRFGAGGGSSRPTPAPPYVKPERKLQPPPAYVPQPSEGENALRLVDLPSEILETIFLECDLPELVACKRVCKTFNSLLSQVTLQLHFDLRAASLSAPSHVREQTTASTLLNTLRERQRRFRTFDPSLTYRVSLDKDEGRLYEYLEGVLAHGNGLPHIEDEMDDGMDDALAFLLGRRRRLPTGATIYDLHGSAGDWESVHGDDETEAAAGVNGEDTEEVEEIRYDEDEDNDIEYFAKRRWNSGEPLKDFAMDPGQDLFVAAEMHEIRGARRPWRLNLKLMRLSDFTRHPDALASARLDNALEIDHNAANLILQVCGDKIFIYSSLLIDRMGPTGTPMTESTIVCWNWQTGELVSVQHSMPRTPTRESKLETIEDVILIDDMTYAAAMYVAEPTSGLRRLDATLGVYRLLPADPETEITYGGRVASHIPVLAARFMLPRFRSMAEIGLRADPPPRRFFPTHKPLPLYPTPGSGVCVVTFDFDIVHDMPLGQPFFYTLFVLKETLLDHLPDIGEAPSIVPFSAIAPHSRFRNDILRQGWSCYVYGSTFVSAEPCTEHNPQAGLLHCVVENYDPKEVRYVQQHLAKYPHIEIVSEETLVSAATDLQLLEDVTTGSKMPYTYIRDDLARPFTGLMVDDQRITMLYDDAMSQAWLEVLQF